MEHIITFMSIHKINCKTSGTVWATKKVIFTFLTFRLTTDKILLSDQTTLELRVQKNSGVRVLEHIKGYLTT